MISGRKDCQSGHEPCRPISHAEALYCQGSHAEATRTDIAEAMDVNPSTLANWLDPHHTSHIPTERLEHLLRLTDDRMVYVRYLASLQGLVVFDPTDARNRGVARMVSEFGDLLKALDEITADQHITPDEAKRFEAEAEDLHAVVASKVAEIKRAAGIAESGS